MCHYSYSPGFLQKTIKNISFHKVVPGILVCVPCPRSTFAFATLYCTFLTNKLTNFLLTKPNIDYIHSLLCSLNNHNLHCVDLRFFVADFKATILNLIIDQVRQVTVNTA